MAACCVLEYAYDTTGTANGDVLLVFANIQKDTALNKEQQVPQRMYDDIESAIHTTGCEQILPGQRFYHTCKSKDVGINYCVGDFMFKFVEKRWNPNAVLLIQSTIGRLGGKFKFKNQVRPTQKFLYIFL